ncbi:AMP-binding protein [Brevundimonas sp.]|uniref:class I adenylate-forming enzyme family protein n=1 Tax=Brevundimonas sp. TaxID=1871086 RepID=UPI0026056200|nr:AMP-binding protein [Brevundimonas sp.]
MSHPIRALYDNLPAKADRPALFDGDVTLTHGELIAMVEAAAGDLAARGVGAGDRVGLCARNSWRHVVAYLAILRAGAVWTPLNPRNGARLNGDFQARANLSLTLIDTASVEAAGVSARRLALETWLDGVGEATPSPITDDADAPFALKFTGGSTGVPKGVVQSQASGAAALRSLQTFYDFMADDVNLAVAPLTHGSSHYVLPVLAAGGAHVLLAEPDRAAILSELRTRVTTVFMPPTLIALLMGEAGFQPDDFPRLRHLTYSAAPMSPDRIAQAIQRFGPVVSTLYGQTEAPMTIAGLSPEDMAVPDRRASVGRLFADTPVRLLTGDGDLVERGEGEIVVGGDLTRTIYLDAPGLTAASRHDDWLKTGDIGRIGEDGLLHLIGRSKDLIITGGYNVYPGEVEAALNLHPMVREACAFSEPDDVWGERLEAAVAAAPDADPAHIMAFVREQIGPVRTPKRLHLVDALPRNPVGKVVRDDVRALCRQMQTRPLELAR